MIAKAPARRATHADRLTVTAPAYADLRGPETIPIVGPDVWGLVDGKQITEGCLRGGVPVVIVPVISGGSGGVFRTLIYVASRRGPGFLTTLSGGGNMRVTVEDGLLVERSLRYKGPDCGHTDWIRRFFIARGRLVALDARSIRFREDCKNGG